MAFATPLGAGPSSHGAGLECVSARGATVITADGRSLVDLTSGGFGHGHPLVVARVAEQMRVMPLSSRMFYSGPLAEFVRAVAAAAPGDLEVSYPCNSGAEAVEGALKLARGFHPRRRRCVAMIGAYHGATLGALGVCGVASLRRRFDLLPVRADLIPYGDLTSLHTAIDGDTAAVIVEPVSTGSGVQLPPAGYLTELRRRCTATGALLIADEITTGLGRTGKPFGSDHEGVVPDILVLGGALGGGLLPIAAYVSTRRINDRVYGRRNPALHGSTTGGNPAACVAATAVLETIQNENLPPRAARFGAQIELALRAWQSEHPAAIRRVAVRGLLGGMQFADASLAARVQRAALEQGVLLRLDPLPSGEAWIGVRPPLLVTNDELVTGLSAMDAALRQVLSRDLTTVEA